MFYCPPSPDASTLIICLIIFYEEGGSVMCEGGIISYLLGS